MKNLQTGKIWVTQIFSQKAQSEIIWRACYYAGWPRDLNELLIRMTVGVYQIDFLDDARYLSTDT
eukprot:UN31450